MKKLHKLEINYDKLLKNEELLVLKGGYDGYEHIVNCQGPGIWQCSHGVPDCSDLTVSLYCTTFCPGSTTGMCM